MIEDKPWGPKGLSCAHGTYLTLAIAVVEMARQDIEAGARVFGTFGTRSTGEVMQRAAVAWRWMSDPTVVCKRLSFKEICDGTGTDLDVARDGIDAMARGFEAGYREHLEHVAQLLDSANRPKRYTKQSKEARGVGAQQEEGRGGADR